jgi:SAM-dependent methyltransferase
MRTALFNVDLLNMQWSERWDTIFLLDVLEHISDDVRVLKETWTALTPRGLVFITVPALKAFWTWNDTLAGHRRRYSVKDFHRLALQAQFEVVDARYFMFILSPVLVVARLLTSGLSEHSKKAQMERMHAVPPRLLNKTLEMVFSMEARLGHRVRFPWGTSLLVALRKN